MNLFIELYLTLVVIRCVTRALLGGFMPSTKITRVKKVSLLLRDSPSFFKKLDKDNPHLVVMIDYSEQKGD